MQAQSSALAQTPSSRTITLSGQGISMHLENGQLRLEDGPRGEDRRTQLLSRGTNRINRILILSGNGSITLRALRWCDALGIHVAIMDDQSNAPIMQTQLSRSQDTKLRRAQAMALNTEQGTEIARFLLGAKCNGQRENLLRLGYETPVVDRLCAQLDGATGLQQCLTAESKLATIYWDCLSEIVCFWDRASLAKIPEHWQKAGSRTSLKSRGPKNAITPVHAILNYLYRLAEIEVTIALHAIGLDPGFGFFHTDFPNRNSFALDCLEAIRPIVDAYVLDLVENRTFKREDFAETPTGLVRLSIELRREFGATMPLWGNAIAPVVEHIANSLRPANGIGHKTKTTPLTNSNARQSRTVMKANQGLLAPNAEQTPPASVPVKSEWFSTIHDNIVDIPTTLLVSHTGLGKRYIKQIKSGQRVPDRSHWRAFLGAVAQHRANQRKDSLG